MGRIVGADLEEGRMEGFRFVGAMVGAFDLARE